MATVIRSGYPLPTAGVAVEMKHSIMSERACGYYRFLSSDLRIERQRREQDLHPSPAVQRLRELARQREQQRGQTMRL